MLSTNRVGLRNRIEPRESNPPDKNDRKIAMLGFDSGDLFAMAMEPKGIEPADENCGTKKVIHSRFLRVILAQGPC